MTNKAEVITVQVSGEPPIKRGPGGVKSIRERRRQKRSEAGEHLKLSVEEELRKRGHKPGRQFPWNPLTSLLHLEIKFVREKCQADAANIIGGIADELQDVLYKDDNQLRQITYQEDSAEGHGDSYTIAVYSLEE